jgi:hypothetical protein
MNEQQYAEFTDYQHKVARRALDRLVQGWNQIPPHLRRVLVGRIHRVMGAAATELSEETRLVLDTLRPAENARREIQRGGWFGFDKADKGFAKAPARERDVKAVGGVS